jgi:hypothetical protein
MSVGVPNLGPKSTSARSLRPFLVPFGLGAGAICAAVFEILTVLTSAIYDVRVSLALLPYALAFVLPIGALIGGATGAFILASTFAAGSLSNWLQVGIYAVVAFIVGGTATAIVRGLFADPGLAAANFAVSGAAAALMFGVFGAAVLRSGNALANTRLE